MQLFKLTIALLIYMANGTEILCAQNAEKETLFIYSNFYPHSISGYEYLVVEPFYFSAEDVQELKSQNDIVLAYLSVGEIDKGSWFYHTLKPHAIGKNEIWNSEIISLANIKVYEALMQLVTLYIDKKGYDGIFLDNVDNYTIYGPTPDHKDNLVSFLKNAKIQYPHIKFMQNAGLEIIDDTAPFIDALAIESIASDYNFETQEYQLRDYQTYKERAFHIKDIENQYHLPIIAIEYAEGKLLKNKIIKRIKAFGWKCFIGQINLQGLPTFKEH